MMNDDECHFTIFKMHSHFQEGACTEGKCVTGKKFSYYFIYYFIFFCVNSSVLGRTQQFVIT